MSSVAANLKEINERIARAAEQSGRLPADVTLIAVTKTVPTERILEAYSSGVRHFGENRVQEALSKFADKGDAQGETATAKGGKIPRYGNTLHMIGSLQRNKAHVAASFFDVVHSVDRVELAEALESSLLKAAEAWNGESRLALPVLIEVNVTGEASKSGVSTTDLPKLAEAVSQFPHLQGIGLMTIASLGAIEQEARRTFAQLRQLMEKLKETHPGEWRHLSMGMSDDYEPAIREGATMIRLGRAIFGNRPPL